MGSIISCCCRTCEGAIETSLQIADEAAKISPDIADAVNEIKASMAPEAKLDLLEEFRENEETQRIWGTPYVFLRAHYPEETMIFENFDVTGAKVITKKQFCEYIADVPHYAENVKDAGKLFDELKTFEYTTEEKEAKPDTLQLLTFIKGFKKFKEVVFLQKEPDVKDTSLTQMFHQGKKEVIKGVGDAKKDVAYAYNNAKSDWMTDFAASDNESLLSAEEVFTMVKGTHVLFSFGAKAGGFDLAKYLQRIIGEEKNRGWVTNTSYIDAVQLRQHKATVVVPTELPNGKKIDKVLNPHWAEFYYFCASLVSVTVVLLDKAWMDSINCVAEAKMFSDMMNKLQAGAKRSDDSLFGKFNIDSIAGADFRYLIVYDAAHFKSRGEVRKYLEEELHIYGADLIPGKFDGERSTVDSAHHKDFFSYLERSIAYRVAADKAFRKCYKELVISAQLLPEDRLELSSACTRYLKFWRDKANETQIQSRAPAPAQATPAAPAAADALSA